MRGGMFPVQNSSGNIVNQWDNSHITNQQRLDELLRILNTRKDRNSESYKELLKEIRNLKEEIERKKILKQQKEANKKIIENTIRFNKKTRNYVQDFINGIYLPGEMDTESNIAFKHALRMSKGIYNEDELTRIIKNAKKARENRISNFTKAKVQLESMPYNSMWAYRK